MIVLKTDKSLSDDRGSKFRINFYFFGSLLFFHSTLPYNIKEDAEK